MQFLTETLRTRNVSYLAVVSTLDTVSVCIYFSFCVCPDDNSDLALRRKLKVPIMKTEILTEDKLRLKC